MAAPSAPTAIEAVNAAIGSGYILARWADDNPAGVVTRVKFFELAADGITSAEVFPAYDRPSKTFVWKADAQVRVALGNASSQYNAPTGYTTLPAGTDPPVIPPPPPPETPREKLEDVLGDLATGSRVVVYPDPTVVLTVNGDGTVT